MIRVVDYDPAWATQFAELRDKLWPYLRDHLREHAQDVAAYVALKRRLAAECWNDVDEYARQKSDFILAILARHAFSADDLEIIDRVNHR